MAVTISDASGVPAFYKFFFLWFDPICSGWGAYMDFFDPATVMAAYNPTAVHTRTQDILFQQIGAPFLALVLLDVFLLRYTKDLYIWKVYQWAVILIDAGTLYSFYDSLSHQGRLAIADWTSGDWGCIGVTAIAGIVRLAFVAELGYTSSGKAKKKI